MLWFVDKTEHRCLQMSEFAHLCWDDLSNYQGWALRKEIDLTADSHWRTHPLISEIINVCSLFSSNKRVIVFKQEISVENSSCNVDWLIRFWIGETRGPHRRFASLLICCLIYSCNCLRWLLERFLSGVFHLWPSSCAWCCDRRRCFVCIAQRRRKTNTICTSSEQVTSTLLIRTNALINTWLSKAI